eukprot:jgi/Ulvmu1/12012/UM083_0025.1
MVNHKLLLQSIAHLFSFIRLPSQRRTSLTKSVSMKENDPSTVPSQLTTRLDGYRVTGILGSGGNGVVLEAVSVNATGPEQHSSRLKSSQERLAIKCSSPGDDASAAVLEVCRPKPY